MHCVYDGYLEESASFGINTNYMCIKYKMYIFWLFCYGMDIFLVNCQIFQTKT